MHLYWEMLLFKNCALAGDGFLEEPHQNISKTLNQIYFLKQFFDKGRLKDILRRIPMNVILDEEFGLFSAACRAKMLLKT